jgi:hypothetical protein
MLVGGCATPSSWRNSGLIAIMASRPKDGDEIMKTRATQSHQSQYLGVLKYRDPKPSALSDFRPEIPVRWIEAPGKEERIARILNDLPEACFRGPATLCDTLRAIYREIYRQHPELKEPIASFIWEREEGTPHGNTRPFLEGTEALPDDQEGDSASERAE